MKFTDFNRIPGFTRALRPVINRQMAAEIERAHDRMVSNWNKGRDAKGRPWEPLSPETVRQKGHSQILIEEGDMIGSTDHGWSNRSMQGYIAVDDEKAAVHEFGLPDMNIPARPMVGPAGDLVDDEMDGIVGSAIDSAYRRSLASGAVRSVFEG